MQAAGMAGQSMSLPIALQSLAVVNGLVGRLQSGTEIISTDSSSEHTVTPLSQPSGQMLIAQSFY